MLKSTLPYILVYFTYIILLYPVSRTCGKKYDNTRCFQRNRQISKIVGIRAESWSCTCEGDLCNSAPLAAVTTPSILMAVAAALLS